MLWTHILEAFLLHLCPVAKPGCPLRIKEEVLNGKKDDQSVTLHPNMGHRSSWRHCWPRLLSWANHSSLVRSTKAHFLAFSPGDYELFCIIFLIFFRSSLSFLIAEYLQGNDLRISRTPCCCKCWVILVEFGWSRKKNVAAICEISARGCFLNYFPLVKVEINT